MTAKIRAAHTTSKGTYGAPCIQADLVAEGIQAGLKRIARLMRAAGLSGVSRRKGAGTTIRDDGTAQAPDLVDRNFVAQRPNQLWVADITYIPTWPAFSIWRSCLTLSAAASSAGRWRSRCTHSWCSMLSTWRS